MVDLHTLEFAQVTAAYVPYTAPYETWLILAIIQNTMGRRVAMNVSALHNGHEYSNWDIISTLILAKQ